MRRSKHHNLIPAIKSFRSSTLPETQEPLENVLNFRKQLAHKLKGFCMVRLDNFMIGVILPIAGWVLRLVRAIVPGSGEPLFR
ncbi:hypothetical protein VIMS_04138 [Mycobacterium marinum]|nr:hypothetical protein VIMS_04138 [Mycobacterium marinum]